MESGPAGLAPSYLIYCRVPQSVQLIAVLSSMALEGRMSLGMKRSLESLIGGWEHLHMLVVDVLRFTDVAALEDMRR